MYNPTPQDNNEDQNRDRVEGSTQNSEEEILHAEAINAPENSDDEKKGGTTHTLTEAQVAEKKLGIQMIVLGAVFVFIIVATFALLKYSEPERNYREPANRALLRPELELTDNDKLIFWPRNFSMRIKQGWEVVDVDEISVSDDLGEVRFAIQNQTNSCLIVFAHATEDWRENYTQAGFSKRVTPEHDLQIDGDWYLPKEFTPDDFDFEGRNYTARDGEMMVYRFNRYFGSGGGNDFHYFGLFDQDNGTVQESCKTDLYAMLSTVGPQFPQVTLNSAGQGHIVYDRHPSADSGKDQQILFVPDSNTRYGAVQLGRFSMNLNPRPTVYDDKIYFVAEDSGELSRFDPFSSKLSTLDLLPAGTDDWVIEDYIIHNEAQWFYLTSRYCNPGQSRECETDFYYYDVANATSTLLAEGVESENIAGYDPETSRFGFYTARGDAGCLWATTEYYNISTDELEAGSKYEGCGEDPFANEEGEVFDEFREPFYGQQSTSRSIRVSNGRLGQPSQEIEVRSMVPARFFPADGKAIQIQ